MGPEGFAGVTAFGQAGTTGGEGGPVVEVGDAEELLAAIGMPGPTIVLVQSTIAVPPGLHKVSSHTTVLGADGTGGITGGGLSIGRRTATSPDHPDAVRNVIIRDLRFHGAATKAINVEWFAHHVWIDHNELSDAGDGLIDIKRGATHVTVSWNHTHTHRKNMLLGHSDDNHDQDVGRLKVTYHHNWFDHTMQRNPRARFGNPVHVFNNYYLGNCDVGVAAQAGAGCVVEGNFFEDVDRPATIHYAGPPGNLVLRNNFYLNSGEPEHDGGHVEDPRDYYDYTLDDAREVKALVTAGAGITGSKRPVVRVSGPVSGPRRYDRTRPRPPRAVLDLLHDSTRTARPRVVDLAAGTGLSALAWMGRAAAITAVEPAEPMRAVLRRNIAELPDGHGCAVVDATAENTGLPDESADLVTVFHAFQWLDPHQVLPEAVRILRPGGVFAIAGTAMSPRIDDAVDAAFAECRRRVAALRPPDTRPRQNRTELLTASGLFRDIRAIKLHASDEGDADRLIDLIRTLRGTAALLRSGHTEAELGIDRLGELAHDRLRGPMPWTWTWTCYLATRG